MEIVEHKSDLLILKTPRETKKSLYFYLLFFLIIFSILIIIVLSLYIGTQSKLGIWLILVLILFIPVLHSFYNAIFKEHLKDCALSKKTGIIYFTNQSKFQKLTSTSTIKKYGLDQIKQIRLVEEIYYDYDDDSYERKEYSTELILKLDKPIVEESFVIKKTDNKSENDKFAKTINDFLGISSDGSSKYVVKEMKSKSMNTSDGGDGIDFGDGGDCDFGDGGDCDFGDGGDGGGGDCD